MIRTSVLLTSVVVLLCACNRDPGTAAAPVSEPAPVAKPAPSPAEELDRMDGRTPVPLLPMMAHHQKQNMRDHLVAVQEIVTALAADDYAVVEQAAARIGYSEQMGRMCTHMGAGAPGFTEQAIGFHRTADRIGEAAREQDRTGVLTALGATLQTCTSCHETWKQQIVDEAAWEQATSAPPPAHAGH